MVSLGKEKRISFSLSRSPVSLTSFSSSSAAAAPIRRFHHHRPPSSPHTITFHLRIIYKRESFWRCLIVCLPPSSSSPPQSLASFTAPSPTRFIPSSSLPFPVLAFLSRLPLPPKASFPHPFLAVLLAALAPMASSNSSFLSRPPQFGGKLLVSPTLH